MHMAGERAPVNAKMVNSLFLVVSFGHNYLSQRFISIFILSEECFTTGAASPSFIFTNYDLVTKNEFEYVKVEKNPKKKGYVQQHTTHGDLNIELHCDIYSEVMREFHHSL
ncbi:hypothetical protein V6N12_016318 [Hibiscus sabdariffa]|uniref:Uncharacterized protein n=1 Tax=Hibiscus sabdariffa TaxID=183260 RepID=A0ABR2CD90_9ROSI